MVEIALEHKIKNRTQSWRILIACGAMYCIFAIVFLKNKIEFVCRDVAIYKLMSKHAYIRGHYRPARETPFEWRFSVGSIVAKNYMLAGVSVRCGDCILLCYDLKIAAKI